MLLPLQALKKRRRPQRRLRRIRRHPVLITDTLPSLMAMLMPTVLLAEWGERNGNIPLKTLLLSSESEHAKLQNTMKYWPSRRTAKILKLKRRIARSTLSLRLLEIHIAVSSPSLFIRIKMEPREQTKLSKVINYFFSSLCCLRFCSGL